MAFVMIAISSCVKDEDKGGRFPEFLDAPNMRIIVDPGFSTINADDPGSTKLVLDFYSENLDDIEKVDLYADFFDYSEGVTTVSRSFLKNVPLSNFSGGVLKGFEVSFSELKTALGLGDDEFNGLDQVTIYNETTMKDGRVYPSQVVVDDDTEFTNIGPNILNSAATTSFTATIPVFVQCPLEEGFATGAYMLEQISGPDDPFFGNPYRWAPEQVTLTATGPINRTFNGTYLTFDGTAFNFVVTCGNLVVNKTGAGIGCTPVGISWVQDGNDSYVDDSEFTIHLLDNIDGDCGIPAGEPLVLKLTKL